ncbi:MAG: ATP-dependent RNA helicase HrpA [Gammaproteobacteria bacterium]
MLAALHRGNMAVKPERYDALLKDFQRSCEQYKQRSSNLPQPALDASLPIIEARDEIIAAIADHQVTVIAGETGSGKTTQIPQLCLSMGRGVGGFIGHTQPRRIAAKSIAARIADELQMALGQQVAYKVRFAGNVKSDTYVKIMTDGILLAEMQSDRFLNQYDTIIIDEAHERNLNIDFLLGYLKNLLPKRPDLKLIITSATIDTERFARHFDNAPVIEVSGRTYPVEVRYRPIDDSTRSEEDGNDIQQAVLAGIRELDQSHGRGDVLVFFSGERDIKDTAYYLKKRLDPNVDEILTLFARLSAKEQNRVFEQGKKRRIILSTNIAETSLTVPGIKYVIDTGLARINRYNYRTKVQRLPIEKISQANADQRKGRCGRVEEGICVRLYSEEDYEARPPFADPEIKRVNLASVILRMKALKLGHIADFPFIDPPDQRYIKDGYRLLNELTAIDHHHKLTRIGQQLSRMPVDPKIGRMLVEAGRRNTLSEVLIITSALSIQDPRERPPESSDAADEKHALFQDPRSDFLFYLNLWQTFQQQSRQLSQNQLRKWCRSHYLAYQRMREWQDIYSQLKDIAKEQKARLNQEPASYQEIHQALCTGLLGNIGWKKEKQEYVGARNMAFYLYPGSGLTRQPPKWIIAGELIETHRLYAHIVAKIEPEWLAELGRHLTKHHYSEPHWQQKTGHVSAYEKITLYGLVLIGEQKINYENIAPIESRDIFIRSALVEQALDTDAWFYRYNAAVIEDVRAEEDRQRKRGILIDDDYLFSFYDERIPADICNRTSFNRWIKRKEAEDKTFLCLDREEIFAKPSDADSERLRPGHLTLNDIKMALEYTFDIDSRHDGVCAIIPRVLINQVPEYAFDWLVPGFLEEKITALIKGLPKKYRRNFVPAPEYAKACVEALTPYEEPLVDALGRQLEKMTGVAVPGDLWTQVVLPDYLQMSFKIVDEEGNELSSGHDLSELKQQIKSNPFPGHKNKLIEQENLTQWNCGDLPEHKQIEINGHQLNVYPAFVDRGTTVALQNFEQPDEALKAHKLGVMRLYRLLNHKKIKYVKQHVPSLEQIFINFHHKIDKETLTEDLLQCVIERAFIQPNPNIRTQQAFVASSERANQTILDITNEYGAILLEISNAYKAITRKISAVSNFAIIESVNDINSQLDHLIYPGFIADAGEQWFRHIPRYLKGIQSRLEKLERDPQKDRQRRQQFLPYWQQYLQFAQDPPISENERNQINQYHWMLEEMRISLFSQELGTHLNVSFNKLDEALRTLQ